MAGVEKINLVVYEVLFHLEYKTGGYKYSLEYKYMYGIRLGIGSKNVQDRQNTKGGGYSQKRVTKNREFTM